MFFESKAFTISIIGLFIFAIIYYKNIVFDSTCISYIFYYFLGLLPIVLSVFAILISFTDKDFLKFLKEKTIDKKGTSIYEGIVFYFKLNTIWILLSLFIVSSILIFNLYDYKIGDFPIMQYLILFLIIYTTISFFNVVRFIFYYAKKKGEFVEIEG